MSTLDLRDPGITTRAQISSLDARERRDRSDYAHRLNATNWGFASACRPAARIEMVAVVAFPGVPYGTVGDPVGKPGRPSRFIVTITRGEE